MKQIFIVDDDFNTIHIMSIWMRQKNFSIQGFSDSNTLYGGLERELPDAIMLDIRLGKEDGRAVCQEIRKRYSHNIPVILFSMYFSSFKALQDSGANDFIRKDATQQQMMQMLHKHTRDKE